MGTTTETLNGNNYTVDNTTVIQFIEIENSNTVTTPDNVIYPLNSFAYVNSGELN